MDTSIESFITYLTSLPAGKYWQYEWLAGHPLAEWLTAQTGEVHSFVGGRAANLTRSPATTISQIKHDIQLPDWATEFEQKFRKLTFPPDIGQEIPISAATAAKLALAIRG